MAVSTAKHNASATAPRSLKNSRTILVPATRHRTHTGIIRPTSVPRGDWGRPRKLRPILRFSPRDEREKPGRRRVKQVDAAVIRSAPPTPSMRSPTISAISCERWRCARTIEPRSPTNLREKLIGAKVVSRGCLAQLLEASMATCPPVPGSKLAARGPTLRQASFQVSIDPVEKLVGESGGEIGPSVSR